MAQTAYLVTVEDLTGLGGPMGSERTERITEQVCLTKDAVIRFIKADLKKRDRSKNAPTSLDKYFYDYGFVGYSIQEVNAWT